MDDDGGTNPSYRGYAYQKLVTVWVALKLMFGPDASTEQIIVEPASHDDVAAKLDVPAEAAEGELTIGQGEELQVQIKFKGAGHWSAQNFADVVNDRPKTGTRGPAPRARAKSMLLKDPSSRYVFITNTSVDGVLAPGRVTSPGNRPDPTFLPTGLDLDKAGKVALAGRFAMIEQMTPSETRRQIRAILEGLLNVPAQNVEVCLARLERMVEDRFLGVPDPLRRRDIEKVVQDHEGGTHANPLLVHYVPPQTLGLAEQQLANEGAVVLIGPSGYGKSMTAEHLADAARRATPPFRILRETAGLAEIEAAFAAPGRVLFHLEDPWGQSALDREGASRWSNRLPHLMRQASADKQFVITSRSEIYREALTEVPAPIWADRTVVIDEASYDETARRKILRDRLAAAGGWRQDLVRQHEARLLQALQSPLELATFTRELKATARPGERDIADLVDRALTDSRKQVVTDHVRGFGDDGKGGAAVLFALLRRSHGLGRKRLSQLRRTVETQTTRNWMIDELADHLAQTQLQVGTDGDLTAHAKVVEALESLCRLHPRAAERALNDAARAAATLAADDPSWIDELQLLADAAREFADKDVVLAADVVDALDSALINALHAAVCKPTRFRTLWQAAHWRLSDLRADGRLVHWLEMGAPREKGGFSAHRWRAPQITEADREALLAVDPDLRLAKGFVAHVLPWTSDDYDAGELVPWLKAFGIDFTREFLAAGKVVSSGTDFRMSADTISEGAVAWPNPPYDQVWAQIAAMDDAVDVVLAQSREERRQASEGELDFAHQIAIEERTQEEGPSASQFAKGYVRARRRQEGFAWIPGHPRPKMLLPLWAETMRFNKPQATLEELDSFFAAAGNDDALQSAGLQVIGERRLAFGRPRIEAALQSGGPRAMDAAVTALKWLEGDDDRRAGKASAEAILLARLDQMTPARAAMLAPLIVGLELTGETKVALARQTVAAAGPSAAVVQIALADSLKADDDALIQVFRQLGPQEALALIADGPRRLAQRLLLISAAEGLDVLSIAEAWLTSGDKDDAQIAVQAFELATGERARAGLHAALRHPHYRVRRAALRALAADADAAERSQLFSMADDKSAPVREALADVIGEQGWTDGLPILLRLLDDQRNYARHPEHQRRDEPEYHVARSAAAALGKFDPLPVEVVDAVIAWVAKDAGEVVDVQLHAALLDLLTYPDHAAVWTAITSGLSDDHVVGDTEENLYPVRYAAAWAVVHRLSRYPFEDQLIPWATLQAAADHIDPQLAAPALLALGAHLAIAGDAATLDALRAAHGSEVRVALALSMFGDGDAALSLAKTHGLLPSDHPFLDMSDDVSTEAATQRWQLSKRALAWLESLQGGADVEATLLWVMSGRTGLDLGLPSFVPWALRRKESIPIMTMSEMFGME
jgi:hypothetical protein